MGTGRIPLTVHGLLEYGLGVLSILAPFLFGFNDESAPTLVCGAAGRRNTGHGGADRRSHGYFAHAAAGVPRGARLRAGAAFVASPFIFGFSDRGAPLAYFLAVGVGLLLVTVNTRFRRDEGER